MHLIARVYSNDSKRTSNCGKISVALLAAFVTHFFVLTQFDLICALSDRLT